MRHWLRRFFVFPEVIARAEEAEPVAISGARLDELRALIQAGRKDAFYSWPEWQARQLVSVCKRCHEELHPESQRQFRRIRAPLTAERWD